MPRYFFDIDDGEHVLSDAVGTEFDNRDLARDQAIRTLPEIAGDMLPDGTTHTFTVQMRDDGKQIVFEASLVFSSRWID